MDYSAPRRQAGAVPLGDPRTPEGANARPGGPGHRAPRPWPFGARHRAVPRRERATIQRAKVLLHLMAGSKEDAETVTAFFQDMRARGLGDPLLVVPDGAPGIVKALETCFPRSERQRCLAHRMRNLAAKVPENRWPEFKARATACYQAPSRAIARDLAPASSPTSRPSWPLPFAASRTTSRPVSRICGCRSPTARRSGRRTSSSVCSSRSAGA